MVTPAEREFQIYRRGELREAMLRDMREGLRALVDPETGEPFTEDTIRRATARGSRFHRQADAIELVILGLQKNSEFFAQQIRIDRAGSAFLRNHHATLWREPFLPAFGASGTVLARGRAATIWQGSTLIPDGFATIGADPSGRRYQVVITAVADAAGDATLTLQAIDGGEESNIAAGTRIRWINPPPGAEPEATATSDFSGGLDAETDADFARRLAARVRDKPAAANWAHLRALAREASVSVEDAFVYPTAFHAGSVLVAVAQKRGDALGPLARVPSFGVLAAVTAALVPPASPFLPASDHVVVTGVSPEPADLVIRLAQPFGSSAGWRDLEPFPKSLAAVTAIAGPQDFTITAAGGAGELPGGAPGPLVGAVHVMIWRAERSAFESLSAASVEDLGGGDYRIVLAQAPADPIELDAWVSPEMARASVLAAAVSGYFDSLGPGEVVDLAADERGARAFRSPPPAEEWPARAGTAAASLIAEALGPTASASLESLSATAPALPADPALGPFVLVAGRFAAYAG